VVFSWLIAGFGCLFSAMSYAEFAIRIPAAGSSYAYVYFALGELPAVVAAWFLCLEYGVR
jgi:amino acid transporter